LPGKRTRAAIHPVYIVGAGPGDPGLLTVKAARLLESVDVVVYDRLVSEAILDLVPAGATRIYAGKAARDHHMPQEDTNALLVRLAASGRRVMRLKGGDPFLFGRGGEEALHLARHGIPFEIVPGITAATGCAAYAGIPLTHRGLAHGVRFVAGYTQEGEVPNVDWKSLADADTTLVFYMGRTNARRIAAELMAAGLDGATPTAALYKGTTPEQRTIRATLADLADRLEAARLVGPTLLVVGRVSALAESLAWFEPGVAGPKEASG
jgi:uroporphyrin-III C-methyltransferase/precorrin-2 dehydrogenase/sirohydrochlorin ferrochelatase/uroporphyrin-III C-methyltransferase